ncbi:uncharacterized protein LOC110411184 [Herrania umbratica]|uniref:Uncharacterized protein LOC110411184 n=1 Tax=Herrania umbratica TaxID=108875 RepID=A0A6J0ZPZ5_9ROSI|nr:uncharacterized protein LOC110411184 [Herrania umbratica]
MYIFLSVSLGFHQTREKEKVAKMLLRCSSPPVFTTCIPQSLPAVDSSRRIPSKPISLTASSMNTIQRTWPERKTRQMAIPRQKLPSSQRTTLCYVGGGVGVRAGGKGLGDWGQGEQILDEYYQNMIKTYSGDTLLLTNYLKFLIEVRGDFLKAEEYCERAILLKPDDGEVLSMYGDLIWINHGDRSRALHYSHRAAQTSPDDCHVLAAYARLEWAAGKEEEDKGKKDEQKFEHQTLY